MYGTMIIMDKKSCTCYTHSSKVCNHCRLPMPKLIPLKDTMTEVKDWFEEFTGFTNERQINNVMDILKERLEKL